MRRARRTYWNGDYYEGEWIDGTATKEGRGKYFYFEKHFIYEGYWKFD